MTDSADAFPSTTPGSIEDAFPADLAALAFDDRLLRSLPVDPSDVNVPRQVEGAVLSRVTPRAATAPKTVAVSPEMMEVLGLGEETARSRAFAEVFSGTRTLPGCVPYAMNYGGHQFGHWAGQLGDGRAIHLGEVVTPHDGRWSLQLKGAGPTPYARSGDGLAVLRSSVREFLCSEAMHHLGIPTTRALSLVTTGEDVMRDMFYDGHPKPEPGAVVCRMSRSFLRVGSFELPASRGDRTTLQALMAMALRHQGGDDVVVDDDSIAAWFRELCDRTAALVVHWMRVGFVHGVLNTDNLSTLGETIDYGPYGWLEPYDPDWTPNTTDATGRRYRFGAQAEVAHWNLYQLARALSALVTDVAPLQAALEAYPETYQTQWNAMMAAKLGWGSWSDTPAQEGLPEDGRLVVELDEVLRGTEVDWTLFFRSLAKLSTGDQTPADDARMRDAFYDESAWAEEPGERMRAWLGLYRQRVRGMDDGARKKAMDAVNPCYVLRNYLAQEAIDAAEQGDPSGVQRLLKVLRRPYVEQDGQETIAAKRPEWARHRAGCSMLSCSS